MANWGMQNSIRNHHVTSEEDRKRIFDQEFQQKIIRNEIRDRNFYPQMSQQQQQHRTQIPQPQISITRQEYLPPLAHSGRPKSNSANKLAPQQQGQQQPQPQPQPQPQQQHLTSLPKAEPNFNLLNYNNTGVATPYAFQNNYNAPHDSLTLNKMNNKYSQSGTSSSQFNLGSSIVVTKAAISNFERDKDLMLKNNSVIVKNSPSPKSSGATTGHGVSITSANHALPPPAPQHYNMTMATSNRKPSPYDYRRSPNESPRPPIQIQQYHHQQRHQMQHPQMQQPHRFPLTQYSRPVSPNRRDLLSSPYSIQKSNLPPHISISPYNGAGVNAAQLYQQQNQYQNHNFNSGSIGVVTGAGAAANTNNHKCRMPNRTFQQPHLYERPHSNLGVVG